jgi:hypothetical protein
MKIVCPSCKKSLDCPDRLAGKAGQCPKCKTKFRIPAVEPPQLTPQFNSLALIPTPLKPAPPPILQRPIPEGPPPPPPPEPIKVEITPQREFLFEDEFVTVWPDGSADFRVNSLPEAKLVLKSLRLLKKEVNLALKETNASLREVRHEYTSHVRQRGSMVRGGGKIGQIIRIVQTVSRDMERSKLAANIQPLHQQQEYLRGLIASIERHMLRMESAIVRLQ